MNSRTLILVLSCLWIGTAGRPLPAAAERPPERSRCPHAKGRALRRRPLDHWLEKMSREDPDEHAYLQRLRQEDPEALKQVLRDRIRQRRLRNALQDHPEIYDALMALETEEREHLLSLLAVEGKRRAFDPDPEISRQEQEVRRLIQAYRQASTDREREEQRAALRAAMQQSFDLRTDRWRQAAMRAEKQLEHIRRKLADYEARREELIAQRLQQSLDAPPDKD